MFFYDWAERWGISQEAIRDFENCVQIQHSKTSTNVDELSEQAIQNLIRLEASRKGCRIWRNNVGAVHTQDGVFFRYGLANESKAMNQQIKSADLIGIRPVKITQAHVGKVIGQFLSREVKKSNWKFTGSERELAQMRWCELVMVLGGDAGFATGEGTI